MRIYKEGNDKITLKYLTPEEFSTLKTACSIMGGRMSQASVDPVTEKVLLDVLNFNPKE